MGLDLVDLTSKRCDEQIDVSLSPFLQCKSVFLHGILNFLSHSLLELSYLILSFNRFVSRFTYDDHKDQQVDHYIGGNEEHKVETHVISDYWTCHIVRKKEHHLDTSENRPLVKDHDKVTDTVFHRLD